MKHKPEADHQEWIATWLDAVRDGRATMSQRARSSVDMHGGLEQVTIAARSRGVHLLELTDDKGRSEPASVQDLVLKLEATSLHLKGHSFVFSQFV